MPLKINHFVPVIRDEKNEEKLTVGKELHRTTDGNSNKKSVLATRQLCRKVLHTLVKIGGYGQLKVEFDLRTGVVLNTHNYVTKGFSASRQKRYNRAVRKINAMDFRNKEDLGGAKRITITMIVG